MNTHIQTHVMPAKGATYRIDFVLDGQRRETFVHNALCAKHARLMFRDLPWMTLAIINSNKRVG